MTSIVEITLIESSRIVHEIKNCCIEDYQYQIRVEGYPAILLCQYQDKYYALEDKCPHQEREIFGGCIRDGNIICPFHGLKISLKSGEAINPQFSIHRKVKIYPLTESNGRICIYLENSNTLNNVNDISSFPVSQWL